MTNTAALIKSGSGTLVFSGDSSLRTNSTTVNAGTLLLNNASGSATGSGPVIANFGGKLGGTGSIGGPLTINAGGILAPGDSGIGTLTVYNSLTLVGNAVFKVNRSGTPANDSVVVTGALANSGAGTITISNLGTGLVKGDRFVLFSTPLLNGAALNITGGGVLAWSNSLAIDGSIQVASATIPKFTTTPNPFGGINIGFSTSPGQSFSVYSSTNVVKPMALWTRETDLATGNQTMYETTYPGSDSVYSFTVQPPHPGRIFYRVGSP